MSDKYDFDACEEFVRAILSDCGVAIRAINFIDPCPFLRVVDYLASRVGTYIEMREDWVTKIYHEYPWGYLTEFWRPKLAAKHNISLVTEYK